MDEKHLSGRELGKISHVSPAIFSDIARGITNPKFKTMLAIAVMALGGSFSLLIEPEDFATWALYYSLSPDLPKLPRGMEYVPAGIALSKERVKIIKK